MLKYKFSILVFFFFFYLFKNIKLNVSSLKVIITINPELLIKAFVIEEFGFLERETSLFLFILSLSIENESHVFKVYSNRLPSDRVIEEKTKNNGRFNVFNI